MEEPKIIVDDIKSVKEPSSKRLYISVKSQKSTAIIKLIKNVLVNYKGETPSVLYFEDSKKAYGLDKDFWIDEERFEDLRPEVLTFLGNDSSKIILK